MEQKFYICEHCGNMITFLKNSGVPVICCGDEMKELVPGSVDASIEKHVPVVTVDGNKVVVTVGSVAHPMEEKHYIEWILLKTKEGLQRKELAPGVAPKAEFILSESDEAKLAYAYCNIHGLWRVAL